MAPLAALARAAAFAPVAAPALAAAAALAPASRFFFARGGGSKINDVNVYVAKTPPSTASKEMAAE